jgi:hypothetical protein
MFAKNVNMTLQKKFHKIQNAHRNRKNLGTNFEYGENDSKNVLKKEQESRGSRPFIFFLVKLFCNFSTNLKSEFFVSNLNYLKKGVRCLVILAPFSNFEFKAEAHETAQMWKNLPY